MHTQHHASTVPVHDSSQMTSNGIAARRGNGRRRSSTPGRSGWTRSHPPPASVLPQSAARKVSALVWRAHIPDTYAAPGPESATWKDPDPRRRSSRGSGAQNRPVCPAMGATRRLRPVPVSTTSWRYGLRRTSRLVTGRSHRPRSAWPNQARRAPAGPPAPDHGLPGSRNARPKRENRPH